MADSVLVLDCGATNVRAIAVSSEGEILSIRSVPNSASPDPGFPGGKVWDHERIWRDFSQCSREVIAETGADRIGAVTVTTFGVDGTLVDKKGAPIHPVISWQCERTSSVVKDVELLVPELYQRSGVQSFHFNSIYKLAWLRKNRPDVVKNAHAWLFISNLFQHRMTGKFATDVTMAGTSMLTDLVSRDFSDDTLGALGIDPSLFPQKAEAGSVVGELMALPAADLGLPAGLPVVSTGHDTQFAIFGSGAGENEPVLSSGTWEIMMVRARTIALSALLKERGVTTEFDTERGLYNPGVMWIASGLVEWLKNLAFGGCQGESAYESMISEGADAGPGCGGLRFTGDLIVNQGVLSGVGLGTTRGAMARAVFEHLAVKTREALALLENACGFKAQSLVCVGGGSKNRLWNQIRADILGRPVRLVDRKETTALGAACYAIPVLGREKSPGSARTAMNITPRELKPGSEAIIYSEMSL
jgi:L-fuculokinase